MTEVVRTQVDVLVELELELALIQVVRSCHPPGGPPVTDHDPDPGL